MIPAIAAFLIFQSCSQQPTAETANADAETDSISGWYGEEFAIADVLPASALLAMTAEELEAELVVETEILHSCRKKGCWMKVDMGEGNEPMRVSFLDYGFFVPLVSDGRTAVMKGRAYIDTIDVDMLRHFAEDAGKTEEEIAEITEPEIEWSFEATGVYIR
jgi:hypothetical protein